MWFGESLDPVVLNEAGYSEKISVCHSKFKFLFPVLHVTHLQLRIPLGLGRINAVR